MTKDTIIFGGLMGILGNISKIIITWSIHWLGYSTYTFEHIAAGYFVSQAYIKAPISLIIGFLADITVAAFFGVIMYIMLRKTGTDYAVIFGAVTSYLIKRYGSVKTVKP